MIREHRIPTIIGFLILTVGLIVGLFLVQTGQVFFLRAAPEITPTEVKLTNVTDSSFSVSWFTAKEADGFVKFGEAGSSLAQTASDDRDQVSNQTGLFLTHHITLKNLKPGTKYYFKLGSQGRLFDNSGKPYELTTGQTISGIKPPSDLASGTVLAKAGGVAEGAVVYLSMANMTPQSALVGIDGTWVIPLSTALTTNLAGFASYDKQTQVEELFIRGADTGTSTAVITTQNDNPTPQITLGQTYDFRKVAPSESIPAPASPSGGLEENVSPSQESKFSFMKIDVPTPATEAAQLAITNPKIEGEDINAQKPEFQGTGPKGKKIQILVESPLYNGTVTTDKAGVWKWTPPSNLAPGDHKITITYLGKSITRNFTVLAAEQSPLPAFTATPSATLTPTPKNTPIPTLRPTPTTTLRPTPTPTLSLRPTPTSTSSARTAMPATSSGVPRSGNLTPTFIALIMGLMLAASGFILKKLLAHD